MDSRLCGNDGVAETRSGVDSRLRGNDGVRE